MQTNSPITDIASELGFESLTQLKLAFKRMVEEPPHRYRARLPARLCHSM